jgi:hypothetical protein
VQPRRAAWGFSSAVRLVCAQWQAVHDALARRLVLTWQTTDEGMGMLVRRFPAVERSSSRASDGAC